MGGEVGAVGEGGGEGCEEWGGGEGGVGWGGGGDGAALAEYLICEECIFGEIPHELQKHIDYRSYGNELEMQDRYLFTPSGVFCYQ